MGTLERIREQIANCRNCDNEACAGLVRYRERADVDGASHPVLFQVVPKAKVIIIGAVPGSIDASSNKAAYQKLVNGQFSLGHRSAQGLGEIMHRVGKAKGIPLPNTLTDLPSSQDVQKDHLDARHSLGLHVTNLVKCNACTQWESKKNAAWRKAADACQERHLRQELAEVNPKLVVLLGAEVARYFSDKEGWRRGSLGITHWIERTERLPFLGRQVLVTAWAHPGGTYFWIQGKCYWDAYAKQLARFVPL